MKHILSRCTLACSLLTIGLVSCSDDNEHNSKYNSLPPTFTNMVATELETGSNTLHAGKKFVVALEQSQKGQLLYKGTYAWNLSPGVEGNSQKYTTVVFYDNTPDAPTDTLLINTPGTYTLTFTGKYDASGHTTIWTNSGAANNATYWADGSGKVNYSSRGLYGFTAVATKKIVVNE